MVRSLVHVQGLPPRPDVEYVYTSLPKSDSIRYFVLDEGQRDDPVSGRLCTAELRDMSDVEAISYVWGDVNDIDVVSCNDRHVYVTRNLSQVLQQIRLPDAKRKIWADALCINQSDLAERSQQVSLMGEIYSRTKNILICLGPDEFDDASSAVGLFRDMDEIIKNKLREIEKEWNTFPWPEKDDPLLLDARWSSVEALSQNPWFTRGWVIQEAALANTALVVWGDYIIQWASLVRTMLWVMTRGAVLHTQFTFGICGLHLASNQMLLPNATHAMGYRAVPTMLFLLHEARHLSFTDERDRIYAFLELAKRHSKKHLDIIPDYERAFLDVYRDFSYIYLAVEQDLDLISYAINDELTDDTGGLPSWVPRWDTPPAWDLTRFAPDRLTSRAGHTYAPLVDQNGELYVQGVIIDTAALVSDRLTHAATDTTRVTANLWNEVMGFAGGIAYSPDASLPAFIECLTAGCVPRVRFEEWADVRTSFLQGLQTEGAHFGPHIVGTLGESSSGDARVLGGDIHGYCLRRRFIVTQRGYFGLVPDAVRAGDLCCIVFGTRIPFMIRPTECQGRFKLIGPVFLVSKELCSIGESSEFTYCPLLGSTDGKDWIGWEVDEQTITLC